MSAGPAPPRTAPSGARRAHQHHHHAAQAKPWVHVARSDKSLAEKHIQLRDELVAVLGSRCTLPDAREGAAAEAEGASQLPTPNMLPNVAPPRDRGPDMFTARDSEGSWAMRRGKPYQQAALAAAEEADLPPDVLASLQHVRNSRAMRRDVAKADRLIHRPERPADVFSEAHPDLARRTGQQDSSPHRDRPLPVGEHALPEVAPLVDVLEHGMPHASKGVGCEAPAATSDAGGVKYIDVQESARRATRLVEDMERRHPDKPPAMGRAEFDRRALDDCCDGIISAIGGILKDEDELVGGASPAPSPPPRPASGSGLSPTDSPITSGIERRFPSNYRDILDAYDHVRSAVHNSPTIRRKSKHVPGGEDETDSEDDRVIDIDEEDDASYRRRSTTENTDVSGSVVSEDKIAKKAWKVLRTLVGANTAGSIAMDATRRMQKKVARHNASKKDKEDAEIDRRRRMREEQILALKTALSAGGPALTAEPSGVKKPTTLLSHMRKVLAAEKLKRRSAETSADAGKGPSDDMFADIYRDQVSRTSGLLSLSKLSYDYDDEIALDNERSPREGATSPRVGRPPSASDAPSSPTARTGSAGTRKTDRSMDLSPAPVVARRVLLEREPIPKSNGLYVVQEQPKPGEPMVEVFVVNRSMSVHTAYVKLDFALCEHIDVHPATGTLAIDERHVAGTVPPGDKKLVASMTRSVTHVTWKRKVLAQVISAIAFDNIRKQLMSGKQPVESAPRASSTEKGAVADASPAAGDLAPTASLGAFGTTGGMGAKRLSRRSSKPTMGAGGPESGTATPTTVATPQPPEGGVSPKPSDMATLAMLKNVMNKRHRRQELEDSLHARAAALSTPQASAMNPDVEPTEDWGLAVGRGGGLALAAGQLVEGSETPGKGSSRRGSDVHSSDADIEKNLKAMQKAQAKRRKEAVKASSGKGSSKKGGDTPLAASTSAASLKTTASRASMSGTSDSVSSPKQGAGVMMGASANWGKATRVGAGIGRMGVAKKGASAADGLKELKDSTDAPPKASKGAKKSKAAVPRKPAANPSDQPASESTSTGARAQRRAPPRQSLAEVPSIGLTAPDRDTASPLYATPSTGTLAQDPSSPKQPRSPAASDGAVGDTRATAAAESSTAPDESATPTSPSQKAQVRFAGVSSSESSSDDDGADALFADDKKADSDDDSLGKSVPLGPPPVEKPSAIVSGVFALEAANRLRSAARRVAKVPSAEEKAAAAAEEATAVHERAMAEEAEKQLVEEESTDDVTAWGDGGARRSRQPPPAKAAPAPPEKSGTFRRKQSAHMRKTKSFTAGGSTTPKTKDRRFTMAAGPTTRNSPDSDTGSARRTPVDSSRRSPESSQRLQRLASMGSVTSGGESRPDSPTTSGVRPFARPGHGQRQSLGVDGGPTGRRRSEVRFADDVDTVPGPPQPTDAPRTSPPDGAHHVRESGEAPVTTSSTEAVPADEEVDTDLPPIDTTAGDDAASTSGPASASMANRSDDGSPPDTSTEPPSRHASSSSMGRSSSTEAPAPSARPTHEGHAPVPRAGGGHFAVRRSDTEPSAEEHAQSEVDDAHLSDSAVVAPPADGTVGPAMASVDDDEDLVLQLVNTADQKAAPRQNVTSSLSAVSSGSKVSEAAANAAHHSDKFSNFLKQKTAMEGSVKNAKEKQRRRNEKAVNRMLERMQQRAAASAAGGARSRRHRPVAHVTAPDGAAAPNDGSQNAGQTVDAEFKDDPEEYAAGVQHVIDGVIAEMEKSRIGPESDALLVEHSTLTQEMQVALTELRNAPRDSTFEAQSFREQLVLRAWETQVRREFNLEKMLVLIERKVGHHGFIRQFVDDIVYVDDEDVRKARDGNARVIGRFKLDRSRLVRTTAHISALRVVSNDDGSPGLPPLTARAAKREDTRTAASIPTAAPPAKQRLPRDPHKPLTARERFNKLHRGGRVVLPVVPHHPANRE